MNFQLCISLSLKTGTCRPKTNKSIYSPRWESEFLFRVHLISEVIMGAIRRWKMPTPWIFKEPERGKKCLVQQCLIRCLRGHSVGEVCKPRWAHQVITRLFHYLFGYGRVLSIEARSNGTNRFSSSFKTCQFQRKWPHLYFDHVKTSLNIYFLPVRNYFCVLAMFYVFINY